MCSHYEAPQDASALMRRFGLTSVPQGGRWDLWPGYHGLFIRRHQLADVGDEAVPAREALIGSFGLIPAWADDARLARHTYNARSETVATKPSFRDAWRQARHCIIPAQALYEPDWRSGRAVPTRITLADGQPMGLAGLWSTWRSPQGAVIHSYTMLTISGHGHPLMQQFHKPDDEKRMVVILPVDRYDDWLHASESQSQDFLRPYPAQDLRAEAAPPPSTPTTQSLF